MAAADDGSDVDDGLISEEPVWDRGGGDADGCGWCEEGDTGRAIR